MAFGKSYERLKVYHAGDDVVVVGDVDDVERAIQGFRRTRLRANPSKQGLGYKCGEFLRVSFGKDEAGGYLARTVATVVSGNWVTEKTLTKSEALANYANMGWTLAIRSGYRYAGAVLVSTVVRRVPEVAHTAFEAVTGGISVMGSPVFGTSVGDSKVMLLDEGVRQRAPAQNFGAKATEDFINSFIDEELLKQARVTRSSLKRLMLEVSYKDRSDEAERTLRTDILTCPRSDVVTYAYASQYEMLHEGGDKSAARKVLEGLIGNVSWEQVFDIVTGSRTLQGPRVGNQSWPVINSGTLGVAALAAVRNRMKRGVAVSTSYPILV
jgi:hypothetical protein